MSNKIDLRANTNDLNLIDLATLYVVLLDKTSEIALERIGQNFLTYRKPIKHVIKKKQRKYKYKTL